VNIVLIGYRATGKTSVGRGLARRLGLPFHDTDEEVQRKTGSTIRELVALGGWDLFRKEEKAAVAALSEKDGCILSLGGGAILDPENRSRVRRNGLFVWLRADAETIIRRVEADDKSGEQRPPLADGDLRREVSRMLGEREAAYREAAHVLVETGERAVEEIVEEIVRSINKGK
jgi:shikimate kinase